MLFILDLNNYAILIIFRSFLTICNFEYPKKMVFNFSGLWRKRLVEIKCYFYTFNHTYLGTQLAWTVFYFRYYGVRYGKHI